MLTPNTPAYPSYDPPSAYFYGSGGDYFFSTIVNWWSDSAHTVPYGSVPYGVNSIQIDSDIVFDVDIDSFIVSNLIFTGTSLAQVLHRTTFNVNIILTGSAYVTYYYINKPQYYNVNVYALDHSNWDGSDYETYIGYDYSIAFFLGDGNVICSFLDNASYNNYEIPFIPKYIDFFNNTNAIYPIGSISNPAKRVRFVNGSVNNTTIYTENNNPDGGAIFYDTSSNNGKVIGGIRLFSLAPCIKSLVDWSGHTGLVDGTIYDSGGNIFQPIISFISASPAGDITVNGTGSVNFYGSVINTYNIIAPSINFYDTSSNEGSVATYTDSFTTNYKLNSVVFNDYSVNQSDGYSGIVTGDITYYSITIFHNYSHNNGTLGNSEFYDHSYNGYQGNGIIGKRFNVYYPVVRPIYGQDSSIDLITYYNYPYATIFTGAAMDGDWSNLANWTDDLGNPAYFYPDFNSSVVIQSPITQSLLFDIKVGIATFESGSYIDYALPFYGNAIFTGDSYNEGYIYGQAIFRDTSYNAGEIQKNITLEDFSFNSGLVHGDGYVLYPSFRPVGGTILGAIIYEGYPVATIFAGSEADGDWANLANWRDIYNYRGFILPNSSTATTINAPVTQISSGTAYSSVANFSSSSYWGSGITLNGNASFIGNSYNAGTITGHANVYFPSPKPIGGTVNGGVTYYGYGQATIFTGVVNGNWANINNWTTATGDQAFYLPNTFTDVKINASVTSCSFGTIECKTASFYNSAVFGAGLTLYGHAYFYNLSSNLGTIHGNADVYFPSPKPIGGSVTGSITYHGYSQGYIFNNNAKDGDWANLVNWSDGFGFPAEQLPISGINVIINAPITQISTGTANCATATFNTGSYWGEITLHGNASFLGDSYNAGAITGNASFTGSSINNAEVDGDAVFSYKSVNLGSVGGNATFNDGSYNNGLITGNAKFNQYVSVGGDAIDSTGYANGVVGGTTYDKNGNAITAWRFYTTHLIGTDTGDAKVYYPLSLPLGGTVTGNTYYYGYQPQIGFVFKGTAADGDWGNLENWLYSSDGVSQIKPTSYPTSADNVFIDAVVTQNTQGNAYCNNAYIYSNFSITLTNSGLANFWYNSINNGEVLGDALFNEYSSNTGIVGGVSTFNDESYNNGTLVGTSSFYFASYNEGSISSTTSFHDYSYNASIGEIYGTPSFLNGSYNVGYIEGNANFFNSSYNIGYIVGNSTFNDTSYNNGYVDGDATFTYITLKYNHATDITGYASGEVSGAVKDSGGNSITYWLFKTTNLIGYAKGYGHFYNSSICQGEVSGTGIFENNSSNTGVIDGNAYVYYPVHKPLGGTVHGTITYFGYEEQFDFLTVNINLSLIKDYLTVKI